MFPQFFHSLRDFTSQHRWHLLALFAGVVIPLVLFGHLAEEVHRDGGLASDVPLLELIHRHANPRRDLLVAFLTRWGGYLSIPVLLAIAVGLWWRLHQTANAVFFSVSVVGSLLMNLAVKALFQRARPALWMSPAPAGYYSFPSGHSMVSMAIALALVFIAWPTRLRWPALVLAIPCVAAIGLSRLYLGVHYPSDVLGGWSAAILWVTGVSFVLRRYRSEKPTAHPLKTL
ncbi:undecaprenyl-diphosphatase [Abditibacterium utsteinense]|uniref:Undecaprenyl-diphosphatase n=1 Tax=Abditibacterium utsteinense TaxID=1960156 RepID=A0A2S8SU41_9BACT|nr:phosphatase PAP2 family protein [Abditibacterium utsteinense]PQV64321.1 undecaprenyl-diphosphatase [Abditibacterium utsteinense]